MVSSLVWIFVCLVLLRGAIAAPSGAVDEILDIVGLRYVWPRRVGRVEEGGRGEGLGREGVKGL